MKKTTKRETGDLGEDIVVNLIKKKGWQIVERNFLRPWGEIDIVAREKNKTHFIEVKTRTVRPQFKSFYRGEEAVHYKKQSRLARIIQTYLSQNDIKDWQIDIVVVELDKENKQAKMRWLKNVIFEN